MFKPNERLLQRFIISLAYLLFLFLFIMSVHVFYVCIVIAGNPTIADKYTFYYSFLPLIIGFTVFAFRLGYIVQYEDRLEVRNLFGVINTVYFEDLIQIKKIVTIFDTAYIFDDGRRDNKYDGIYTKSGRPRYNNNYFAFYQSEYNYKTSKFYELEDFITEYLKDVPVVEYTSSGERIE